MSGEIILTIEGALIEIDRYHSEVWLTLKGLKGPRIASWPGFGGWGRGWEADRAGTSSLRIFFEGNKGILVNLFRRAFSNWSAGYYQRLWVISNEDRVERTALKHGLVLAVSLVPGVEP